MSFTSSQGQAVAARGNVVVIAGAGTGKTRTLVERAVQRLLDPAEDLQLDQILMVTFTEAAAAEMRHRIRQRLEDELVAQPGNERLLEQLALLDSAHISTLHSFCLQLVRQHFYELGLDPQLTVLSEQQARLLASDVLDELFQTHYAGELPGSTAVLDLLQSESRGWELPIRERVLALHHFTQTRPNPEGWLGGQLNFFAQPDPAHWRQWLVEGFHDWRDLWLPVLRAEPMENPNALRCAQLLESTARQKDDSSQLLLFPGATRKISSDTQLLRKGPKVARSRMATVLQEILQTDLTWPKGRKGELRKPLDSFYRDAAFLASLAGVAEKGDPLVEDWQWVRGNMIALLTLAQEFAARFATAKRQAAALDFHDLEQLSLQLLWDQASNQATPLAEQWRERFKLVLVDEYQDINAAQDRILTALSREGPQANRFLVGDFKQSIYRFRQADPSIFQTYAARWQNSPSAGQAIYLSDNFRSQESLLNFINPLFASLMRKDVGGVDYDEQARLRFGDAENRWELRSIEYTPGPADADGSASSGEPGPAARQGTLQGSCPRVEVLLRIREKEESFAPDSENEQINLVELSETEIEARLVALRLAELLRSRHQVWDRELKRFRDVAWRDMVVLLRSPRFKVESYAKEFHRAGVPLQAKRSGFFESTEVSDLVNLLCLLDNPLQDVPAIAVLRSPLVGLTVDELAEIRLARRGVLFWVALQIWYRAESARRGFSATNRSPLEGAPDAANCGAPAASDAMFQKVHTWLENHRRWRAMSRHASLSQRLETVLAETNYLDWLLTQPRGPQRQANVQQLLTVAREFDDVHRQSLYRFLTLIEAQQEAAGDREPAPLESHDAVRLMSIHQSKGLEFPVVVVADLGKRFNLSDNTSGIIIDEHFGPCSLVKPPRSVQSYPSLPHWLARQRKRREALGEELRVLYVALTRAQDTLILAGTASTKAVEKTWADRATVSPSSHQLLRANSYLDWLGPWLTHSVGNPAWATIDSGRTPLWCWRTYRETGPLRPAAARPKEPAEKPKVIIAHEPAPPADPAKVEALVQRMSWDYPLAVATTEPAKTTITALRRRAAEELDDEAAPTPFVRHRVLPHRRQQGELTPVAIGTLHHRFLQLVALDQTTSLPDLEKEAERLCQARVFTAEESRALNLKAVHQFWQSEVGRQIRAQSPFVKRELAFTLRLAAEELTELKVPGFEQMLSGDFIIVQGIVDLAVLRLDEMWLLDFKTDDLQRDEMAARVSLYETQIRLYSHALTKIYHRPVSHRWLHYFALEETVEVGV